MAGYKWALSLLFCLIVRGYQLGMIRAATAAGKVRYRTRTVLPVLNGSDCACEQKVAADGLLDDNDKPALVADDKQVRRDLRLSDLSADDLTIFRTPCLDPWSVKLASQKVTALFERSKPSLGKLRYP